MADKFDQKELYVGSRTDTDLTVSDFDYYLPEERIAQTPLYPRDSSRLMVIDRSTGNIEHKHFYDICDYINENDVLVINDSRVIPARIYGHAEGDESSAVELLLLKEKEKDVWECLARPGKKVKNGRVFEFGGILKARAIDVCEDGNRIVGFEYDKEKYQNLFAVLHEIGLMPLPPYITETLKDRERYQTVYSREEGSAAAPTAGLHFTEELLERIKKKGVDIVPVMLHVGLGTFRPMKTERVDEHIMHTEYFSVSEDSAERINRARAKGGRIIAVGTTSARTLESCTDDNGRVHALSGNTGIFIYPGYKFKAVDTLVTNFHLPKSTLLMLVSALYSREAMLRAYEIAVKEEYRFFSFGDAMMII